MKSQRISLRAAIDKHCKACLFDRTQSGTWRQQVEGCTSTNCNLYSVRPMTREGCKNEDKQTFSSGGCYGSSEALNVLEFPEKRLNGVFSDHPEGGVA